MPWIMPHRSHRVRASGLYLRSSLLFSRDTQIDPRDASEPGLAGGPPRARATAVPIRGLEWPSRADSALAPWSHEGFTWRTTPCCQHLGLERDTGQATAKHGAARWRRPPEHRCSCWRCRRGCRDAARPAAGPPPCRHPDACSTTEKSRHLYRTQPALRRRDAECTVRNPDARNFPNFFPDL